MLKLQKHSKLVGEYLCMNAVFSMSSLGSVLDASLTGMLIMCSNLIVMLDGKDAIRWLYFLLGFLFLYVAKVDSQVSHHVCGKL